MKIGEKGKREKQIKKAIVSGLIAVFVMSVVIGLLPYDLVQTVSADPGWSKKAPIHINNTGGGALSYYQVNLNITYDSDMNNNFSDLRVKNETAGVFVPYWIEDKSDGSWCNLWFNATSIPTSSWCNDTYYLYYGDVAASSGSNITTTFLFGDDFEGGFSEYSDRISTTDVNGHPFMALLFDKEGNLVLHDTNKTYLYYENISEGHTYTQEMNVDTLVLTGAEYDVKAPDSGADEASAHLVMKVSSDFYVMFYTKWPQTTTVRSAYCSTPNGSFTRSGNNFEITATEAWEWHLESNGMWRKISEDTDELLGWIGYGNMGSGGSGEQAKYRIGWAKVKIHKTTHDGHTQGDVELVEKHASNPLTWLIPSGDYQNIAYGGGCIDKSVIIDGKYVLYYFTRTTGSSEEIWRAVSTDELFLSGTKEKVDTDCDFASAPEKYQFYLRGSVLHLFYEGCGAPYASRCRKYQDGYILDTNKWTEKVSLAAVGEVSIENGILNVFLNADSHVGTVGTLSNNNFGQDKIIEAKVKFGEIDNYNKVWGGIGFNFFGASTEGEEDFILIGDFVSSGDHMYGLAGTSKTNKTYSDFSPNVSVHTDWKEYKIVRKSSEVDYNIDDSVVTVSTNVPNGSYSVGVTITEGGTDSVDCNLYCDYFFVRKYTSSEPNASLGSEQTANGGAYEITLLSGWNIIGWTDTTSNNAEGIETSIGTNCTYSTSKNMTSGLYETHEHGFGANNFNVERGWGYYVYLTDETVWNRT